ncbi:DUF4838 domain-containing protein [Paenibacillus cymbidii]|uniref:DUF4838 domain-containing protein n=1 Tax=Paenibacillus cymbidii TaxID=1639034 RepID=UPI00107FF93F|nr:DUF4838 domain-containing protein [Paenibacillus cymbidii]
MTAFAETPIVVNKGRFATVPEAAFAEREVDWSDESNPDAAACTACFAAVELRRHLCRLTGADALDERHFPFLDMDSPVPEEATDRILVGGPAHNTRTRRLFELHRLDRREEWTQLPGEGYWVLTLEEEGRRSLLLAGTCRVGTLYAVYAFLETLGFRWFGLGDIGAVNPPVAPFVVPPRDFADFPRFRTRGIYSEHIDDSSEELTDWLGRNRINFAFLDRVHEPHKLKKRGVRICAGGHNILSRYLNPHRPYPYPLAEDPYSVSPEYRSGMEGDGIPTYFEAHPEWFGLVDGKRSDNVGEGEEEGCGDNYCTTNEDATTELCKNVVQDLIDGEWKHVDYVNFWMLDNGRWCSCELCEAAGNYSYKMILVANRLRQTIRQALQQGALKRDIKILFPVYHETLPPPDRPLPDDYDYANCYPTYFPIERCYVHFLEDEACTETNADLMRTYRPWTTAPDRHYTGELFIGEYYNVGSFAASPVPFMTIMKHEIPFYYKTGIRHFHYMHMTDRRWGTTALTNYQLYRLLWNPESDSEPLLADYFSLSYKELATEMRHFYETLETAMRNAKFLKHYQYLGDQRLSLAGLLVRDAEQLFPLRHMQYDTVLDDPNAGISLVQTVELLARCRRQIDSALMAARDEAVVRRLLEDEMRFSYLEDMVHFLYNMARTNLFRWSGREQQAKRAFARARAYAEKLERNQEATKPSGRFDLYNNGLKASWAEPAYRRYFEQYGE